MSFCVPTWDVDNNVPSATRTSLPSNSNSTVPDLIPTFDYEVAELTWQNGQIWMNGMGLPRTLAKPITSGVAASTRSDLLVSNSKYRASGTLESIVNQATRFSQNSKSIMSQSVDGDCGGSGDGDKLVPWFEHRRGGRGGVAAVSNTLTMDALVPCSNRTDDQSTAVVDESMGGGIGTRGGGVRMGCSAHVGSCGGGGGGAVRVPGVARVPVARQWDQSVSERESHHVTPDTCDREMDVGYTSASMGSPENTSSVRPCTRTTAVDDHDSVCHSTQAKFSSLKNQQIILPCLCI